MTTTQRAVRPTTAKAAPAFGLVLVALVIVYVVWGSTYLAIRIVVEEAPPLTSMGLRYSTAALILAAILMLRGGLRRLRINRRQAVGTAFLGLMLPLLGNGMVSVAEDRGATSGITALLIAIAPLIIVLFRLAEGEERSVPFSVTLPWDAVASVTHQHRDLDSSVWTLQPRTTEHGTDLQVGVSGQVNVHARLQSSPAPAS